MLDAENAHILTTAKVFFRRFDRCGAEAFPTCARTAATTTSAEGHAEALGANDFVKLTYML